MSDVSNGSSVVTPAPAQVTTTVSQPHLPQLSGFAGMDSTSVFLAAVIGAITFVGVVVGIWATIRKAIRENKADEDSAANNRAREINEKLDKMNTGLENRLGRLEDKASNFMPKSEIMASMEHEKNNRIQSESALLGIVSKHTDEIRKVQIDQGRLDQRQDNLAEDVQEIKVLIRTSMEETKALIRDRFEETKQALKDQSENTQRQLTVISDKEEGHFKELCGSLREISSRTIKT